MKSEKSGKVLEVSCNGLTNGGVQHVILDIVRNLHNDIDFDILVFTKGPDFYDDEFLKYGNNIFRIPNRFQNASLDSYLRVGRIISGTYRILKENGPYDAIHCHNYFESALCLIAAKKAGVKVRIVHSHNDLSAFNYSFLRNVMQFLYRKCIVLLATDKIACSQKALKYLLGKNSDGKVIFNAIDLDKFHFTDKNRSQSDFRLVHVGSFSEQKNQLFIIDIFNKLKATNPNLKLTLVGRESNYLDKVKEKISALNLDEVIEILPHNADIPSVLKKSDLFIFPSTYEGLGIVVIEAQAVGLHCIVSDAVPIEADLGNVQFVNGFDVDDWTDCILSFVKNGNIRKKVDMQTYDIVKVAEIYKAMYLGNKI